MSATSDYSGEVTNFEDNKIGSIALWENEKENDRQPEFTGGISFYNGKEKFKIAIWRRKENKEVQRKEKLEDY
ncbi:hypothetical protein AKJ39_02620 [candidate division MSBL1 archaeon SCGC-AAA259J03]|uniref:Uncharacterized protein n=1 Tax=candidate division MSBL1 archaeon SCGC-AAA259J03 TaxID=1698269 RepID=A0A656YW31_9EURY|nr:hypothetical protein AKJ39_02620 [candidate division MSBL1 archaeon SCGC-AAA259J03]